jgi:flagellar export protein FliJ
MSQKRARIAKVVNHREQQLDRRVAELGEARAEEKRREDAAELERMKLEKAEKERLEMSSGAMSAADWRAQNEWLASRALSHAVATREVEAAVEQVVEKQQGVLTARQALKGVELLDERLRKEELRAEERADQRLQDELARGRSAGNKRGRETS